MEKNSVSKPNERLIQLIEWAGITTHAFAQQIGMKRSENLHRMIRNGEEISLKLATMIIKSYPTINYQWLLNGEGEMEHRNPDDIINIPIFDDIDMAVRVSDNAMYPTIPAGSTILAKKQKNDTIIYGKTYLIEIEDIALVRIIRETPTIDDVVTLISTQKEDYDNIVIEKSKIKNLYLVCGVINSLI